MDELLDANGKPIAVGCMVKHTRPDDQHATFGQLPRRVTEIRGRCVLVNGGMGGVPVYLGSLVEVVS